MATPIEQYVEAIRLLTGCRGTWLPNAPITLGDIGFIQDSRFHRESCLEELGIMLSPRFGGPAVQFHATQNAKVTAGAGALAAVGPPEAGIAAGVHIGFEKAGGFVFQAEGCVTYALHGQAALSRAIGEAVRRRAIRWDRRLVVVNEVMWAETATILFAHAAGASAELSFGTPVTDAANQLARAEAGLGIRALHGSLVHVVAEHGIIPAYKTVRPKLSA
jgi:hypothetical protein